MKHLELGVKAIEERELSHTHNNLPHYYIRCI